MKKVILFSFFLISTVCLTAQESSDFIGKWKFQDIEGRDLSDTVGTRIMEKVMKTLTYRFIEDGSYSSSFIGSSDVGTWEYNQKLNKLIIYSSKGEIQPFDVESYSAQELRLKDRKQRITVFQKEQLTAQDSLPKKNPSIQTTSATIKQLCKLWYLQKKENAEYSKEQQDLANSLIKGFIYRFDEDGTVYTKAFSVENETQWVFGENNETIIIKGESFDVVWNVIGITDDELILSKGDLQEQWVFSTKK